MTKGRGVCLCSAEIPAAHDFDVLPDTDYTLAGYG